MKNSVKRIAFMVFVMGILSTSVMGADIHDVSYDLETSIVTISGKTDNISETATLEILQPGVTGDD